VAQEKKNKGGKEIMMKEVVCRKCKNVSSVTIGSPFYICRNCGFGSAICKKCCNFIEWKDMEIPTKEGYSIIKKHPYDFGTNVSHFSTCPYASEFKPKKANCPLCLLELGKPITEISVFGDFCAKHHKSKIVVRDVSGYLTTVYADKEFLEKFKRREKKILRKILKLKEENSNSQSLDTYVKA